MKNPPVLEARATASSNAALRLRKNGFALVISLSLMVLLTILAVGMLGLSSLSLRTSGRDSDLAEARANARLALSMAIAQLQKASGPDQRITMAADQLATGGNGEESAAAEERRHWTGVYKGWDASAANRPTPSFVSWMVSGDPKDLNQVELAKNSASGDIVSLIGEGTVGEGNKSGLVKVPALRLKAADGGTPRIAWWSGDQGVKAALATPPTTEQSALGDVRATLQSAPSNAVEFVSTGDKKPFEKLGMDDERVPKVTSWQQAAFLAADPKLPRALFHDLAPFSTGLLTNVRSGGFRKDLSMQLERSASTANSTLTSAKTALYKVGSGANAENGINLLELWAYYNLCDTTEMKSSGSAKFTTGGNIASGTKYLQVEASPGACETDDEFFFKQPTIISYQMVISLKSMKDPIANNQVVGVVFDPVITLWNPLDIPVVVPAGSFFSVKYWPVPYTVVVNGVDYPLACCVTGKSDGNNTWGDSNFVTLEIGKGQQQVVLKPGEVVKFSQTNGIQDKSGADHSLVANPGFNFGAGVAFPLRNLAFQTIPYDPTKSISFSLKPNQYTAGATSSSGSTPGGPAHTRHFSLTHHEVYVGEDRAGDGASLGYGGMFADWDFGNKRLKPSDPLRAETGAGTKDKAHRLAANSSALSPRVFKSYTGRTLTGAQLGGSKSPIAIVSFNAKTEAGTDPTMRTRCLGRFNPKAHFVDFYDLGDEERDIMPYEFTVDALDSWKNRSIESSSKGEGFFGGGMNAETGVNAVITHSIPREPIVSLAALQHSLANGFEFLKPKNGYAILNCREPLLPQISHAIGNSVAPPMLQPAQTEGVAPKSGRPLADHSYLANKALWDDWYFSGIAPQTGSAFSKPRTQRVVADEFLKGTGKLPVVRYMPDTDGLDPAAVLSKLFSGANPTDTGTTLTASMIRVDGLFNVNSTSVEAWKALLGTLRGRPVVIQSATGSETLEGGEPGTIPVPGLLTPQDAIADGENSTVKDPAQWVGRRTLTEDEIDQLARAVVKEVRKRGPFLSLADFINRRPGSNKDLARAGAIQCALDSEDVKINAAYNGGDRGVSQLVASRFKFPEAEKGPSSYGIPGAVKQADILTPIAPVLSARSDSFIIRAYGESVDKNGKVLARAWCEAVVERSKDFVDETDLPETQISKLVSTANTAFGRRYQIAAFRWLHPEEV